jgi:para-aminobenzoate synthetase component 1
MDRAALLDFIEAPGSALFDGWSDDGRWTVALPEPLEERRFDWGQEDELDRFLRAETRAPRSICGPGPFSGGWVGLLSYELGAGWEDVLIRDPPPAEPAALFYRHERIVALPPGAPAGRRSSPSALRLSAARGSMELPEYCRAVEDIRSAISRGDVYQVNLTRVLRAAVEGPLDPREVYEALAGEEPPPFSAILRTSAFDVVSASPELFLRGDLGSGRVETRPIKGTAPRSADLAADREAARRLLGSEKDRAENVMIADLARNDLGRVCRPGSVEVAALCRLVSHRVHHLETTVRGVLREEAGIVDLLRASFPPGSMTGAPKRAAVAAIRRLEREPRGVYAGAIGFVGIDGRFAFNVAIRTAIARAGGLRYHTGGGIVWDSSPESEWEESEWKARPFLDLVSRATEGRWRKPA